MRHIPEDELHAYLDQGLSRTQCVEIESHLAACPSCQALRDSIAALRDRTTALLARLGPPHAFPPAFEVLQKRAAIAADRHRRRTHVVAWAASLVAAVGVGWGGSSMTRSVERVRTVTPSAAAMDAASGTARPAPARPETGSSTRSISTAGRTEPSAGATVIAGSSGAADAGARTIVARPFAEAATAGGLATRPSSRSAGAASSTAIPAKASSDPAMADQRLAALAVLNPTPALELTHLERPQARGDVEFGGMWRTMSWDGARAQTGERVPHIDGLRVMQVQVQSGERGARPVMVVAQQLASGQVIRTIEGPATDVSQLLSRRSMADVDSLFLPGDTGARSPDAGHAMAMQVGDRMLAITGDLPSDSLRAMIRRLNAEMRSK